MHIQGPINVGHELTASLCDYTRGNTMELMNAECLALKSSKVSCFGAFLEVYLVIPA